MKTQRLAFTQLHKELVILEKEDLRIIRGGVLPTQWEYAIDPQGNVYWRVAGDETWITFNTLNEVEIVAHQSSSNWGSFISFDPLNPYGGGSGGSGGLPANGTLAAAGASRMSALDIINTMFTAFGVSASHAQASAIAIQPESSLLMFTNTSKLFGVWDIASNALEFIDSEATWQSRLEDGSQLLTGIGLTFFMTNPAGLVIGGLILASWEIYEYKRDHLEPIE